MRYDILVKRVYEPSEDKDGHRILVDRLWPRGIKKEAAALDEWAKTIAPGKELRQSFHRGAMTFEEFSRAYLAELEANQDAAGFAAACREKLKTRNITFLYASKNDVENHALVLRDWVRHPLRQKKRGLIYVHGKGGNAAEADHYKRLFPAYDVTGFDYKADTPWEAREEFPSFFEAYEETHDHIILAANSIGAFLSMYALYDKEIEKAFFISPIVDMEKLIHAMMKWADVSEQTLKDKGVIETEFGETLSWEYLLWIRKHPLSWKIPTAVLYGANDELQTIDMIESFAAETGAGVTVMKDGGHWFHTEAQMEFLDNWILDNL